MCAFPAVLCAVGERFSMYKTWIRVAGYRGDGEPDSVCGIRFFLSGVFTFLIGCIAEKRLLTMKRSSYGTFSGRASCQTTVQYVCFYIGLAYTTGTKGSIINASRDLSLS